MEVRNTRNLIGSSLRIRPHVVSEITHRTVGTAAIDVVIDLRLTAYRTSADGHVGITINMAASHSVVMAATAAIDITHLGSAKVSCPYFFFTNSAATDGHVSISCKTSSRCFVQSF